MNNDTLIKHSFAKDTNLEDLNGANYNDGTIIFAEDGIALKTGNNESDLIKYNGGSGDSHTHTNKSVLDKLGEFKGNLTYDGVSIKGIEDQVIAEEYEPSKTYLKDSLVIKNGRLYKKKLDESLPNPYVRTSSDGLSIGSIKVDDKSVQTVNSNGAPKNVTYGGLICTEFLKQDGTTKYTWRAFMVTPDSAGVQSVRTKYSGSSYYSYTTITIDGVNYYCTNGYNNGASNLDGTEVTIIDGYKLAKLREEPYIITDETNWCTEEMVRDVLEIAFSNWNPLDWEEVSVAEVLKNIKNNNSINYSTEEQEIGTWVDGRKIYRKTFVIENFEVYAYRRFNEPLLHNIDFILNQNGYIKGDVNDSSFGLARIPIPAFCYSGDFGANEVECYSYVMDSPNDNSLKDAIILFILWNCNATLNIWLTCDYVKKE